MPVGQPVAAAEELVPEGALGVVPLHEAPPPQDRGDVIDEFLAGLRTPGVYQVDAVGPGVAPACQLVGDLLGRARDQADTVRSASPWA
jgi:hypothetical protein